MYKLVSYSNRDFVCVCVCVCATESTSPPMPQFPRSLYHILSDFILMKISVIKINVLD